MLPGEATTPWPSLHLAEPTAKNKFSLSLSLPQSTNSFPRFGHLPIEIRLNIWKLSIPHGRVIRVKFDWDAKFVRSLETLAIPSILHICRESREVGLKVFSLGFGSVTTEYDQDYFNSEADMLYVPLWTPPDYWTVSIPRDFTVDGEIVSELEECQYPDGGVFFGKRHLHLARVEHLAIPLEQYIHNVFSGFTGTIDSDEEENRAIESSAYVDGNEAPRWLSKFPNLKTVTFLIDHFPMWHRTGDIVLYEPLEVPILEAEMKLPSELQREVVERFNAFQTEHAPDWKIPSVEILVMSFKPQHSGFYVPSPPLPVYDGLSNFDEASDTTNTDEESELASYRASVSALVASKMPGKRT